MACAVFLAQPLLRSQTIETDPEQSALSIQREALYETIRDLDHDFETGKITETDHQEMREALRERAVELLRRESAGDSPADAPRCPGCDGEIDASWTFCSRCGARLGASG